MEPEGYFTKHFEKNKQTNIKQHPPKKKNPNKEKALFTILLTYGIEKKLMKVEIENIVMSSG